MVDAALREVLIGRLRPRKQIFGRASAKVSAVRRRKECVDKRRYGRMQSHAGTPWKDALPGILVRHGSQAGDAEPLNQAFVGSKEKCLVATNGAADRCAELVPLEWRYRIAERVEEVLGVKRGVPKKFKSGAVNCVLARTRHGIDDASGRPAEFGRIRICQDLKFKYCLHTKQDTAHRTGRLVVHIVDVGAVQEKVVLLRASAIDGNLWRPASDNIVSSSERCRHAGLKQRELLKGPAVERQIPNLLVGDETAHGSGCEIDRIRIRDNSDFRA